MQNKIVSCQDLHGNIYSFDLPLYQKSLANNKKACMDCTDIRNSSFVFYRGDTKTILHIKYRGNDINVDAFGVMPCKADTEQNKHYDLTIITPKVEKDHQLSEEIHINGNPIKLPENTRVYVYTYPVKEHGQIKRYKYTEILEFRKLKDIDKTDDFKKLDKNMQAIYQTLLNENIKYPTVTFLNKNMICYDEYNRILHIYEFDAQTSTYQKRCTKNMREFNNFDHLCVVDNKIIAYKVRGNKTRFTCGIYDIQPDCRDIHVQANFKDINCENMQEFLNRVNLRNGSLISRDDYIKMRDNYINKMEEEKKKEKNNSTSKTDLKKAQENKKGFGKPD